MQTFKYETCQRIRHQPLPLVTAVGLALSASSLQAAVITVNTLDDGSVSDQCTLRDAIRAANSNSQVEGCASGFGSDRIQFASGMAGTITLTEGQLDVLETLSIEGSSEPGGPNVTIDGNQSSRLFAASAALSISDMNLTNGFTSEALGGSIIESSDSALSLENCVVTEGLSVASISATRGALRIRAGSLTVLDSSFYDNEAANEAARGGGGSLTYGGAIYINGGVLDVQGSVFSGNKAGLIGGAIAATQGATVFLSNNTFTSNTARIGGAVALGLDTISTLANNAFYYNVAEAGGALLVSGRGEADLTSDHLEHNQADYGGGAVLVGFSGRLGGGVASVALGRGQLTSDWIGESYLNLSDVTVESNVAGSRGGGALVKYESAMIIESTTFEGNATEALPRVSPNPQAIDGSRGGDLAGGGIALIGDSILLASSSVVSMNESGFGGGVAIDTTSSAEFSGSTITSNTAEFGGGLGLGFESGARSDPSRGGGANVDLIDESVVSYNTADIGGGAALFYDSDLDVKYSQVVGNSAQEGPGGLFALNSTLAIENSQIVQNQGTTGGGIVALRLFTGACDLEIENSTISGNSAVDIGGIDANNCQIDIEYSSVLNNTSSGGIGGIRLISTAENPAVLSNVTISNNVGAIIGGAYLDQATVDFLTLSHNESTYSVNAEPRGGGESVLGGNVVPAAGAVLAPAQGDIVVRNSIFSNNSAADQSAAVDLLQVDLGNSTIVNYSLIQTGGPISGDGNLAGVDPMLGPLADNGGPTSTRALGLTSPALDVADPATTVSYDQRGAPYPRVFNSRADMGAFEFFIDRVFADRFEQP